MVYCARTPASGGETTLFDGIEVRESLSDPLREKFATNDLLYSFKAASEDEWPLFAGVLADRDHTLELLAAEPGVSYTISGEDTIDISYRVSARPSLADSKAFLPFRTASYQVFRAVFCLLTEHPCGRVTS